MRSLYGACGVCKPLLDPRPKFKIESWAALLRVSSAAWCVGCVILNQYSRARSIDSVHRSIIYAHVQYFDWRSDRLVRSTACRAHSNAANAQPTPQRPKPFNVNPHTHIQSFSHSHTHPPHPINRPTNRPMAQQQRRQQQRRRPRVVVVGGRSSLSMLLLGLLGLLLLAPLLPSSSSSSYGGGKCDACMYGGQFN